MLFRFIESMRKFRMERETFVTLILFAVTSGHHCCCALPKSFPSSSLFLFCFWHRSRVSFILWPARHDNEFKSLGSARLMKKPREKNNTINWMKNFKQCENENVVVLFLGGLVLRIRVLLVLVCSTCYVLWLWVICSAIKLTVVCS